MWFTETPWPPVAICLVLAAGTFAYWYANGSARALLASLGLIVLSGVVVLVERLIVTDAEQVEAAVVDLAQAVETNDVNRCVNSFSPQDAADRDVVQAVIPLVHVEGHIRVSDVQVTMSSTHAQAVSHFRASGTISFQGHSAFAPTRWELTWQREGNEWKIFHIRRLSFLKGDEIKLLSPPE